MDFDKFAVLEESLLNCAGTEQTVVTAMHRAVGLEPTARIVDVSWRDMDSTARIVIADGSTGALPIRRSLQLAGYHSVRQVRDVHELLREMRGGQADLVLLDPESPGFSGSAVLQAAGVDPGIRGIPIVIVSHDQGPEARREALELGASDFLQKPADATELLPRVRNLLVVRRYYRQEMNVEERVEGEVQRRIRDLQESRDRLILCLARAAEHRDNETGNHVIRVAGRRGPGHHARACGDRRLYPGRARRAHHADGPPHCAGPPRTLGWGRLSGGTGWRGHSCGSAHRGGVRCV